MPSRLRLPAGVCLALVLSTGVARAGDTPRALACTSPLALGVELGASVAAFAAFSLATGDPASACGWCASNGFDRGVRDVFVMDESIPPAVASYVLTLGFAPAVAFGLTAIPASRAGVGRYGWQDAWMILNTVVLTAGITDGVKKLADRQRPGFHFGRGGETEAGEGSLEANLSFLSGHTSMAFSFVASATAIAAMRGYGTARWIAGIGGGVALGAGILRIAADMHWATDVLAGAAVGTLVGAGMPLLLHRPVEGLPTAIAPMPVRGGGGIVLGWRF